MSPNPLNCQRFACTLPSMCCELSFQPIYKYNVINATSGYLRLYPTSDFIVSTTVVLVGPTSTSTSSTTKFPKLRTNDENHLSTQAKVSLERSVFFIFFFLSVVGHHDTSRYNFRHPDTSTYLLLLLLFGLFEENYKLKRIT